MTGDQPAPRQQPESRQRPVAPFGLRSAPMLLVIASVALMVLGGRMPTRTGLILADAAAAGLAVTAAVLIGVISIRICRAAGYSAGNRGPRSAAGGERMLRTALSAVAVIAAVGVVAAIALNIADPLGLSIGVAIIWLPSSLVLMTTTLLVLALPGSPAPDAAPPTRRTLDP